MNYISITDFLMNRTTLDQLPPDLVANANIIVPKANDLLDKFGSYRACNSGYRSPEDQARINPKATHSKHLSCQAIDLEDKDGKLNQFCKNNTQILEDLGFWCEERQGGWQHLQIIPPASGHRWFNP